MSEWKIRRARTIQTETGRSWRQEHFGTPPEMSAAMSNGACVIRGFLPSEDCLRTVDAMRLLGIGIETADETTLVVHGNRRKLRCTPA